MLADPRVSVDATWPAFPHTNAVSKARDTRMKTLMQMDAPEHTAQRRLLAPEFTIKKMEALRPRIQRIVDDLIDAMLASPGPVDLVEAFALPVFSQVICALLGVPYTDRDFFQGVARTLVMDELDPGQAMAASELTVEQFRTGAMTPRQIATLGQLLLVAGHDTTASMIALGTIALLTHPDQLRALRDGDDLVVAADAAAELLRYLSITHTEARRVAREDLEIGGRLIRAGDGIIAVKSTADRDHSAFPDPGGLDIGRESRHHLAFGYGKHLCLGAPLAPARASGRLQHALSTRTDPETGDTTGEAGLRRERDLLHGGSGWS